MKTRMISTTVDSLLEMFRDYFPSGDIPSDAQAVRLMHRPTDQGKLAILVESAEWKGEMPPLQVIFDIRRNFKVG
jgi:hypothetical protein